MAQFRYPTSDLQSPDKLLDVLGSFWATTYQGNDLLRDLNETVGLMAQQSHLKFLELVRSISRFDIPVFSQDYWQPIVIRESDIAASSEEAYRYINTYNANCENDSRYGSESFEAYSSSNNLAYGDKKKSKYWLLQKPLQLTTTKAIFNRVVSPTVTLIDGTDFYLTPDHIVLRENPFDGSLWPKREILNASGEIVDRECTLWVYKGKKDWGELYSQFGYALRLRMQSSDGYKQLLNAILDSYVAGSSVKSYQQAIAAIFGVPIVKEAEELVEKIVKDVNSLNVITNRNVYKFIKTAQPVVQEGDTVFAGDFLTDSLQIIELNRGLSADIQALTVENGVLVSGFMGGLTFENKEVPITVEQNVEGKTKVSWELGGFELDVNSFWDTVHTNGVQTGVTLANSLDLRSNPTSEPTAASLPTTINPLRFLVDNLLRDNAYVIKLKENARYAAKLEFIPAEHIRKIQPPHTLCLFLFELVHCDIPVIMEGSGDELSTGYEEAVSGFVCGVNSEVMPAETYLTESVKIRPIQGQCI